MQRLISFLCMALLPFLAQAGLKVVSLNPIMSDLARQVGGDYVEVIDLMKPGMNPHEYRPTPGDLRKLDGAVIVLAAGKGLESYLDDLRGNLSIDQILLELGQEIPSIVVDDHDDHDGHGAQCTHQDHNHGTIDPHWWQSIKNGKRATRTLSNAFSKSDPEHKADYAANRRAYGKKLDELHRWAQKEISAIPASDRILCTSHMAFGYFCHEFAFEALPVQGLSTKGSAEPGYLSIVVDSLREHHVKAVFPEVAANAKTLEALVAETGVRLGKPLLTGAPSPEEPTYEAMMRYNVTSIVEALIPRAAHGR